MAISSETNSELRATLLRCWQLERTQQLRSLFADPRLQPWRYSMAEEQSVAGSVDAIISLLQDRQRTGDGRNALVLFLEVLGDRIDPGDACHGQLYALARRLEKELAQASQPDMVPSRSPRRLNRVRLFHLLRDRFSEAELRALSFYLEALDFEDVPGGTKSARAQELIKYLQRRGRLEDLIETGREVRPDIPWDEVYR